jgi:hypothetical protein
MSVTRVHGLQAQQRSHGADKAARGLHSENMMRRKRVVCCPSAYAASYSFPQATRRPLWCCSLGVGADTGARSAGEAVGDRRRQRLMTQLEMHAAEVWSFSREDGCGLQGLYSCMYNNKARKASYYSSGRCRRGENVGALATLMQRQLGTC